MRQDLVFVTVKESIQCSNKGLHVWRIGEQRALIFVVSFPSLLLAILTSSQHRVHSRLFICGVGLRQLSR
jgi:hypothetical protein